MKVAGTANTWVSEELGVAAVWGRDQLVVSLLGGGRCSAVIAISALADFGFLEADEVPGISGGRTFRVGR